MFAVSSHTLDVNKCRRVCVSADTRPNTGSKGQCLPFNRKGGCPNKAGNCPHGEHKCTVCGSREHGHSFHTPTPTKTPNGNRNKRVRFNEEKSSDEMSPAEKAANLKKSIKHN